ncbi:putative efflux protein, MATE family [Xylanibacter ruminicola]|uniref:Multidrug export protein MepA n=1 Tax=Xylanibacter ruminicola TaxID=839 RepID=A0A1H5VF90_XYLRU|nr:MULTISPECIES: MATE family efflux transporter [Prevotellaceae]SEF85933.1 putative efflux protein, MATE family [Xylanibacter ruminicola]SEW22066.1 putative efflux protein, MATE family [Prevotella sp. khp7]
MKDNKQAALELGQKPVGRLLWQYALPAIVAMTASSLYNIIDRAMIGQIVGPEAIAGLGITFPFMNLSAAFGAAVGVGSSACISVKLGQQDYDVAENLLGNTITLNLIIGFLFMAVSLIFIDPILRFFGASDVTLPYAREFMTVILLGNMVTHMYFGMNAVLRAAGKPRHAMYATLFTVGMNILLVVTFVWWFRWGIRGAALATVSSQSMALCWQMWIFSNKKELLHLKKGIYKLKKDLVRNIISIGISPFLMNATSCVIVIFMNNQFVHYGGDMAVGAYSIANSMVMVFFMFVMGVNQGMQPIVGYNYGAEKFDRMFRCLWLTIACATGFLLVGWALSMLFPREIARIFTTDPQLIELSAKGLKIDMLVFFVVGSQAAITHFFQSIGKVKVSIFLSLSRQLILLLPMAYVFPLFWDLDGVWYAMPASDFGSFAMTIPMLMWYMKKIKAYGQYNH